MEAVQVSTVNEAIAALLAVQEKHGDLSLQGLAGPGYQFSTTIWSKEERRESGFTKVQLPDGVTIEGGHWDIDGVPAAGTPLSGSSLHGLEDIQSELVMQVFAGKEMCVYLRECDDIDVNLLSVSTLLENVFDKIEGLENKLEETIISLKQEVAS